MAMVGSKVMASVVVPTRNIVTAPKPMVVIEAAGVVVLAVIVNTAPTDQQSREQNRSQGSSHVAPPTGLRRGIEQVSYQPAPHDKPFSNSHIARCAVSSNRHPEGTTGEKRVLLPVGAWVVLVVDSSQTLAADVRINLGGPDVGMSEHELQRAEVSPALEQMGSEGMSDHMR